MWREQLIRWSRADGTHHHLAERRAEVVTHVLQSGDGTSPEQHKHSQPVTRGRVPPPPTCADARTCVSSWPRCCRVGRTRSCCRNLQRLFCTVPRWTLQRRQHRWRFRHVFSHIHYRTNPVNKNVSLKYRFSISFYGWIVQSLRQKCVDASWWKFDLDPESLISLFIWPKSIWHNEGGGAYDQFNNLSPGGDGDALGSS